MATLQSAVCPENEKFTASTEFDLFLHMIVIEVLVVWEFSPHKNTHTHTLKL